MLNDDSKDFVLRNVWALALSLTALFIGFGVVGFLYQDKIANFSTWLYESHGLLGVFAFVYLCDLFYGPMSLSLILISKGPLQQEWAFYVFLITVVSILGGHTAYWLGYYLVRKKWMPRAIRMLPYRYKSKGRRFGTLLVAVSAATPLPFSLACWTAGFLKLPYRSFALATLFRFPRMYVQYLGIAGSISILNYFT